MGRAEPTRPNPFVRTHTTSLWLLPIALAAAGALIGLVVALVLT